MRTTRSFYNFELDCSSTEDWNVISSSLRYVFNRWEENGTKKKIKEGLSPSFLNAEHRLFDTFLRCEGCGIVCRPLDQFVLSNLNPYQCIWHEGVLEKEYLGPVMYHSVWSCCGTRRDRGSDPIAVFANFHESESERLSSGGSRISRFGLDDSEYKFGRFLKEEGLYSRFQSDSNKKSEDSQNGSRVLWRGCRHTAHCISAFCKLEDYKKYPKRRITWLPSPISGKRNFFLHVPFLVWYKRFVSFQNDSSQRCIRDQTESDRSLGLGKTLKSMIICGSEEGWQKYWSSMPPSLAIDNIDNSGGSYLDAVSIPPSSVYMRSQVVSDGIVHYVSSDLSSLSKNENDSNENFTVDLRPMGMDIEYIDFKFVVMVFFMNDDKMESSSSS